MNFDDLVKAVSDVVPDFNEYALRGFVKDNIDNSPEFPAMVLSEGFKLIDADIELTQYEILSPEDTVKFELTGKSSKSQKPKIPLTVSHLRLARYKVRFGQQYTQTEFYTPYMFDDMLFINDKRSMIRKVILEKTFARVQENDKDGISVSPIRVNLMFNRRRTFKIQSYVSKDIYSHFIITSRLFHGPIKNKICDTNIIHYMLAKFGFLPTLKKFGLSQKDISFTTDIGNDVDNYEYFAGKQFDDKTDDGPGLFVKVKKSILTDDQSLKFVINLMYVLSFFKIQTIDNVYANEGYIWKVILGIIILEDKAEAKAYSNAETNLKSVDYFIDPITQKRFESFGVPIKDTYDLLVHIFINIDSYMVNTQSQDIYNSRIDVANGILVESYARRIFTHLYYLAKRTNITYQDVVSALRLNPMIFKLSTSGKKDDAEHYIAPPEIIGDNFLLAGGLNKIRLGGKAEQRLHPSMLVAESIGAFVGKYIGKTGYLNPYIPTDSNGAILHPEYTKEIDDIAPFLPK
jgi:hypothetical protein